MFVSFKQKKNLCLSSISKPAVVLRINSSHHDPSLSQSEHTVGEVGEKYVALHHTVAEFSALIGVWFRLVFYNSDSLQPQITGVYKHAFYFNVLSFHQDERF